MSMAMNSKSIHNYGATALCTELVPRGQAVDLPPADQRGSEATGTTLYAVPRQTFGLEMSALTGHVEWRCIAVVQLKGKETSPSTHAAQDLPATQLSTVLLGCQGAELKALSASQQHGQLNPKWSRWDRRSLSQPSMCPTKPYSPVRDTACQVSLSETSAENVRSRKASPVPAAGGLGDLPSMCEKPIAE